MKKFGAIGLTATVVALGLAFATVPADAKHRHHRSGVTIGLSFGSPYYYHPHRAYRPYKPHRYYHPAVPGRYYRGGWNSHVAWCYDRYRSYRASDNTFQPYHAPRRQCRSPYWG